MTRTDLVIKVLTDFYNAEIDCKNEQWLRHNIESLDIGANVEYGIADTFDIAEVLSKNKSMLIQEGRVLQCRRDFNPLKEALLLMPYFKPSYLVFLYSPKQFENKK